MNKRRQNYLAHLSPTGQDYSKAQTAFSKHVALGVAVLGKIVILTTKWCSSSGLTIYVGGCGLDCHECFPVSGRF